MKNMDFLFLRLYKQIHFEHLANLSIFGHYKIVFTYIIKMSNQNIPVVKQTKWLAIVPQLIFMAFLILVYYLFSINEPVIWGCLTYLILSFGSRKILAKYHNKGMQLTKAEKFIEAIECYERSAEYFKNYSWIDKYRFITLFSASNMSYREMALNNIAFCYSQIGNGMKSKYYYEKTLLEFPNSILAKTALNMINSAQNIENNRTL
ncbi:hypothetical protein [Chryseobacterium sp.]|uniref:hypothetical protein n=1 Tax=Chryseobacterium sp. TaxID=1871047 RepID=UPI00388F3DF1